ncbi:hypothetical protein DPEC_G00204460 [Dallia pectoralis]|uniref:Uncharacterized protein n=1 Tax=Dallia pectoralis TaxID=75939 RepID=A0ACC2G9H4_DALPE|nr:hypothetical protein DPEC_G00204460 [Dallia pectoralis]
MDLRLRLPLFELEALESSWLSSLSSCLTSTGLHESLIDVSISARIWHLESAAREVLRLSGRPQRPQRLLERGSAERMACRWLLRGWELPLEFHFLCRCGWFRSGVGSVITLLAQARIETKDSSSSPPSVGGCREQLEDIMGLLEPFEEAIQVLQSDAVTFSS